MKISFVSIFTERRGKLLLIFLFLEERDSYDSRYSFAYNTGD